MNEWESKLESCPFCGGRNIRVFIKGVDKLKYAALCESCDARSGRKATKKEAERAWNRRANNDN